MSADPYRTAAAEREVDAAVADLRVFAHECHAHGHRIAVRYGSVTLTAKLVRLLDALDGEGDRLERRTDVEQRMAEQTARSDEPTRETKVPR